MIIEARNLRKRFRVRTRAAGAMGALRGMAAPRWRAVHAVDDIDLEVAPGETIAFIGPNGAGKSIKLLTGILQRDTGTVSVLGLDPRRQRRRLAYRIGTVSVRSRSSGSTCRRSTPSSCWPTSMTWSRARRASASPS